VDLIAACRVLVTLAERGSVTGAAASLRIAQSVASRRIVALERRLGGPLLERTARSAVLTPFARDLLPSARRLVRLADELELDAERARLRPVTIAVPPGCTTRDLAVADAAARAAGVRLSFVAGPPSGRADLLAAGDVRLAVSSVPASEGLWRAELGAAGRRATEHELRIGSLLSSRAGRIGDGDAGARLHIGPEDDVPHVRDVLQRAGFAAGVLPGQLPVDGSVTAALASVLAEGDLLLCTELEAHDLGLHWRRFEGLDLARGFSLTGHSEHDVAAVLAAVGDDLAAALGAPSGVAIPAEGQAGRE